MNENMQAYQEYADQHGLAVGDLTEAQKLDALLAVKPPSDDERDELMDVRQGYYRALAEIEKRYQQDRIDAQQDYQRAMARMLQRREKDKIDSATPERDA